MDSRSLNVRSSLEATVQELHPEIIKGVNKLHKLTQEQEIMQRHSYDIAANRNFTYQVTEIRMRKVSLNSNTYVSSCLICNKTCHFPCFFQNDMKRHRCVVTRYGFCTVCPRKCHWSNHTTDTFRIESYPVKLTNDYYNLKAKYATAHVREVKQESVLFKNELEFKAQRTKVLSKIQDIRRYLNKCMKLDSNRL